MLHLSTKDRSLNGDPIHDYCRYTAQYKTKLVPTIKQDSEIFCIKPNVSKYSFQKHFKGFDAIQFDDNRINLFDSQTLAIICSFPISTIEKVKLHLKKLFAHDAKSDYSLILSLFRTSGDVITIHLSDILHPYCEELSEAMNAIRIACDEHYHIPVLLGVPYAY